MTDASSILAALASSTQELLEQPRENDTWQIITQKHARRQKVIFPAFISCLNNFCLVTPLFWPLIIHKDKTTSVVAIQNFLRSKCHQQAFLVEEICSLVLALHNVMVILETLNQKPLLISEALEPLMSVLEGKMAYIIARNAGNSAARASYVADSTNVAIVGSPTLKLANAANAGLDPKKAGTTSSKKKKGNKKK